MGFAIQIWNVKLRIFSQVLGFKNLNFKFEYLDLDVDCTEFDPDLSGGDSEDNFLRLFIWPG